MEIKIYDICKSICCHDDIKIDDEWIALGWLNSYDMMELISTLEDTFCITFSIDEITETNNFSTIRNIIAIVKNKLKRLHV
ncbi:MAG: acyl carrier protein [Lachnospiraceae bacterium]|jgi:acyl carrier protein|nr:acyl carrier protein [Lachnospiraceae bacterium]